MLQLHEYVAKSAYHTRNKQSSKLLKQYKYQCQIVNGPGPCGKRTPGSIYTSQWMDGWMNQAYSWLSTTHGHITDCKLLVCMYWSRLVLVRPAASL